MATVRGLEHSCMLGGRLVHPRHLHFRCGPSPSATLSLSRACSHYRKRFNDQREIDEREEHDIELFKREKMRRKPLSRRNSRSISLRRL